MRMYQRRVPVPVNVRQVQTAGFAGWPFVFAIWRPRSSCPSHTVPWPAATAISTTVAAIGERISCVVMRPL